MEHVQTSIVYMSPYDFRHLPSALLVDKTACFNEIPFTGLISGSNFCGARLFVPKFMLASTNSECIGTVYNDDVFNEGVWIILMCDG